ncbi:Retrovirus-related Pol polyprotein from transposon TNT 1-94 [Senna tora]|uniref:Retrovirus-related Pol polyprotein from transposon TNT 1-94 n=1 Tax=Senna tora TaxID=362788 RepID=A0A834TS62_9FABA|nr:Retrovirus-related Pol polyprotein from transposon TNT 1-94 [Senna tora]
MIVFGCLDLDHAFRLDRPTAFTDGSSNVDRIAYEKWERSNCMCVMIMQHSIPESLRGGISEDSDAKGFLKQISDRFATNEKVETSTLLSKLVSMRYKGKGNIREYIMEMSNLVTKLRGLKLELSDDFLVHLVLNSLPAQFDQFKVSYITQKEKWSLNELIAQCVQEEERHKQNKVESAHLASSSGVKASNKRKRNEKGTADKGKSSQNVQKKQDTGPTCFFCKKHGHVKKDCSKFAAWRVKNVDRLYKLDTNYTDSNVNLHIINYGTKRKLTYENSLRLWHKRLGHISKQRMQRVMSDGILDTLDLSNFDVCIECIKGKRTNVRKTGAKRSNDHLELIHTDVLDMFKIFKAEVETQSGKKIKAVKSDRGGEYYDRYDGSGEQRPGPFARFLIECGIVPQYTMPRTPSQNGVAERQNRTLKDMTRNAKFIEDVGPSRSGNPREVTFEEEYVTIPSTVTVDIDQVVLHSIVPAVNEDPVENATEPEITPIEIHEHHYDDDAPQHPQEQVLLRRSVREKKKAISDDYVVYLQEQDFDMGLEDDPITVNLMVIFMNIVGSFLCTLT